MTGRPPAVPEGHYEDLMRSVFGARRWIVASDVAVSAAATAGQLLDLGADACMAIGASRGTGPLPDDLPLVVLDVRADAMMAGIRASEACLDALPAEAVAEVDRFDPDHTARVVRALFSAGRPVAGRTTYGARPHRWQALEDKLTVDALWDAAGVERAPARVVPLSEAAAVDLDQGLGTVWVGDDKAGWHGGAAYLHRVRTPAEAEIARAHLATACDRVRVMPFLEGVPCSIHGIVFTDHVVALRPCEMLVLRRPGTTRLLYAAAATFWDPPPPDRAHMRALVRAVGVHLRQTVGYRGVFTLDGVMTADGFRPTELNPRFGAAIGVMTRGIPRMPLYLMHLAIVEGEALDWQPGALEALLLAHADAHRAGRVGTVSTRKVAPVALDLVLDGGVRPAGPEEIADAVLRIGPAPAGSYVSAQLASERLPIGPSVAPCAAAILAWADARFGLGIGPLAPAQEVRI